MLTKEERAKHWSNGAEDYDWHIKRENLMLFKYFSCLFAQKEAAAKMPQPAFC